MNDQLQITVKKAQEASEDVKTFYRAFVSMAERLNAEWRFQINGEPARKVQPFSFESLRHMFSYELEAAQDNFLQREKRAGKDWSTVDRYVKSTSDPKEQTTRRNYLRLLAWRALKGRFLEGLCLMSTLSRMSPIGHQPDIDPFGQIGPIHVRDEDGECFLWTRPLVESQRSGLNAIPDIAITRTPDKVSTSNIVSVIECKCRDNLGASDLRAEFGKAYDLGSPSYVLVSYYSVRESLLNAGRGLGIDLQIFSLSTSDRNQFIRGERDLGEDMAIKLSNARNRHLFLTTLEDRTANVRHRLN